MPPVSQVRSSCLPGPPRCNTGAVSSAKELESLQHEIGSLAKVPEFIKKVKAGDGVKLMGFGHRVYKNYDPRAKIIKATADSVFEVTGRNPLFDLGSATATLAGHEMAPLPPDVRREAIDFVVAAPPTGHRHTRSGRRRW